jgi:hypothetical protein
VIAAIYARYRVRPGEWPYLIARVGLNRNVLIEAAISCVKSGSGGALRYLSVRGPVPGLAAARNGPPSFS